VQAFVRERTWSQAELARATGVEPRRIRKVLEELERGGMPLERDEEHPHVYWSVPKNWFPGGVVFTSDDWDVLLHALLRIPDEAKKRLLLDRLLSGRIWSSPSDHSRLEGAVAGTPVTRQEYQHQLLLEKAILEQRAVSVRYFSASRGARTERILTPLRLFADQPDRLVAYCHLNDALRWFRLGNFEAPMLLDPGTRHDTPNDEVDAFVSASVDGFHDGSEAPLVFTVEPSAAVWVQANLLPGMQGSIQKGGSLRVETKGGAVVVARFVAGLGKQARAESPGLRRLVCELAQEALESNREEPE
jgi:predicted DNA-binding transcriptional regulator YafY